MTDRYEALRAARADFLLAEMNAARRGSGAAENAVRVRAYWRWLDAVRAFRTSSPSTDPGAEIPQ